MEINESKKVLIDKENKYLFDDENVVVFLDTKEDLETLKKYDDQGYSIKGKVTKSEKTEISILKNYKVVETKSREELKKTNPIKTMLFEKLVTRSSKEGGLAIISFEKFGMKNKIKYLRQELGITQEELAKKANVSRRTISSLENSHYTPSLELAYEITKILGYSNIEDVFILY